MGKYSCVLCVCVNSPVCGYLNRCVVSSWVLSVAKKEDADEDIAKYDGKP